MDGAFPLQDPRSLDAAVQNALLALYPPFEVTAPTVLSQLFRLLDSDYHGDGLCCLLDFLIPAKRLFEHVRQAACAPYFNCIFLHEGWPLCLHEKVVIHLAPLNPLLLRPGDFYLQAEPYGEQSACITVKCLSRDLRTVEERTVPESSYTLLFTNEWLEEINRDLERAPLHTCLVATEKGIAPVPWSKIATPEFISKPKAAPSPTQVRVSLPAHALDLGSSEVMVEPASQSCTMSFCMADAQVPPGNVMGNVQDCKDVPWRSSQGKYPGLIKVDQAGSWKKPSVFVVPSLCDIISQDLDGDYVDLLEFSEEMKLDLLAKSGPSAEKPGPSREIKVPSERKSRLPRVNRGSAAEKWTCGKGESSEEGPCTPCLRRKLNRDPKFHGPRCRYRESYVAALQNPVSFGSGLMAAISEESDVPRPEFPSASTAPESSAHPRQRPGQAAAPRLLSGCPRKAVTQETKAEEVTKQGYLKLLKSPAGARRNLPRSQSPPANHKFSFFKGRQQPASPGDSLSGTSHHEGPWKRMSAIYSPRMSRAKPAGKGTDQTDASLFDISSLQGTNCKNGLCAPTVSSPAQEPLSAESSPQRPPQWQDLSAELLFSGIACLPGSTDKLGRALIQVTTSSRAWEATWCSAREVAQLLLYLCSIPRKEARDRGLTIVVDARRQPPCPTLVAKPTSYPPLSRASVRAHHSIYKRCPSLLQVELLTSLRALSRYVDSTQLTPDLDGTFPYCHGEWVQFFQKLHPFVADLKQASKLLQSSIQELEKGDIPEDMQEAAECTERYRELMKAVLSDVQLVSLQREGGATLARLRKEASRLSFSPDVRNSMDSAMGLYNQVEEEVHTLVTKSNSCLERLEFLRKIREFEAEFGKVSALPQTCCRKGQLAPWIPRQHLLNLIHQIQDKISLLQLRFQGSMFPEAQAFQAASGTMQAKLRRFYTNLERQQAELETLLNLCRFCDKITLLNLDCKPHMARVKLGEGQPARREALQCLEKSLQKLSVEFSAERFQEMKVQAYTLHSCRGLGVWNKAWQTCQETRQILEEMLEKFKEAQGVEPDCSGEEESFSSAATKSGPRVQGKAPHVCKAASNPAQVSAGSKTQVEESGCRARSERELQAHLPTDSDLGIDPRDPRCSQQESLYCKAVQEGRCIYQGSITAEDSPLSAACGADLEQREALAQNPSTEALESLHGAPPQKPPLTLPSQASSPDPGQFPRDSASESLGDGPCSARSTCGQQHRGKMPEAAQYFQVSRHGSFSSEDTESQNSAQDPSTTNLILPMELVSPGLLGPLGKPLGIIYLENHHTNSHEKADAE
uniref:KIAA1755 n=1 Tax=Terrapene triunguis TaxID=2587831 RepID=A0A674IWB5_9SAUR